MNINKKAITCGMWILLVVVVITVINCNIFKEKTHLMKPAITIEKLKKGKPVTIVALGDSLTYGWMVDKGFIKCIEEMLLEKYKNCKLIIINKGIPGDTAFGGITRLKHDVFDYNPDLVFVQFALNDAFSGYMPEQYRKNIQLIIDQINDNTSAEIVLITSVRLIDSSSNLRAKVFYDILDSLASKNRLPIAKVHEYWEKKMDDGLQIKFLIQGDGVHPNSSGHRLMADAIMEIL